MSATDWPDNLLRSEKGKVCVLCAERNPRDLEPGAPGPVRWVGLPKDRGFNICRACVRLVAEELDRVRAEPAERSKAPAKTVRVRIAVGVDGSGEWSADGWPVAEPIDETQMKIRAMNGLSGTHPSQALHWVEADVPLPESLTVQGDVKEATS